jgi:monofunctional glycosyltransferase
VEPDDDRTLPLGVPIAAAGGEVEPRRRRGLLRRVGKWVLIVLGGYYLLCVLLLVAYRFVPPPTTGVQVQRRVEALLGGSTYDKEKRRVALDDLPTHVGRAVVAAEDGRFWTHSGFDWGEMVSAGGEAASGFRIRGASTITQQLMKNLFGTTHPNPLRKLYDLGLTPVAELVLGKERILELYLNEVEWGDGIWGIDAGARHHYDVAATDLSRTQAAGMAALLPNPRSRTPGNTGRYRAEILRRMGVRGW